MSSIIAQRARGRPMGEVATALLSAASRGPGTVAQLAERACVSYGAARYTASRLVSAGQLEALAPGRPAVLGAGLSSQPLSRASTLRELPRSFWEYVTASPAEGDEMT